METDGFGYDRETERTAAQVFDDLYQKYQTAVFSFTYYLTQNRGEAEDLFQETWLRIVKNIPQKVNKQSIKAWIFTIVANLYQDTLRKKRVRRLFFLQKSKSDDKEDVIAGTSKTSQSEEVYQAEMGEDISMAIARLPDRQRRVFVLKEIAGFKQAEIGDILRIPVGTVKSLMYRAVRRLQHELSEYQPKSYYRRSKDAL